MFNTASDVKDATNAQILELVSKNWGVGLVDILSKENFDILKKAVEVETEAEKIAFAIRDRFNELEASGENEDVGEDDIDEFMNSIASELDQKYNGEYEHQPDHFWVPSTC